MQLQFCNKSSVFKLPIFILNRFCHKYVFKMNKAYLRHSEDNEQFQVTFRYINEELKVNRQFNFSRKLSESVETFLSRVSTSVEKAVNKKTKKKKQKLDEDASINVNVSLYLNDEELPKETVCSEIFQQGNNVSLFLIDKRFQVVIDSPWIDTITLPASILANFPTYPAKFEAVYMNKMLSQFIWSKSKDKQKWIEVGKDFLYTPSNEEVSYYLKLTCVPKNQICEGPAAETISESTVEASPGECPFESRHQFTKTKAENKEFRVVTYNILADLYCDSDYTREVLHPYCPPYALHIDYRKQLILKEIIGYNADIICLQEVDRKMFKNDLDPILTHLGYGSNFALKGAEVAEGLAFFWNRNRFQLLHSHRLVFSEHINKDPMFADLWNNIAANPKLSERILARTTTLQANIVQSSEHNELLVVANIHLYFHPDSDHIRLLHGCFAIKYLENLVGDLKKKYKDKRVSLIFCGDFNSVPECGIYKLYTTGIVSADCIDYRSNAEEAIDGIEFKQSFSLDSACGTPKYTNFTAGFVDCLDYIFYERTNLEVTQVVPLPSHEEVTRHTALPSIVFPSDHISLVSDLKFL